MRLILASSSPRRKELIKLIPFLQVECFPSRFDESSVPISDPESYAKNLAYGKAAEVFAQKKELTLGVDTIVTAENRILGKPSSYDEAKNMLEFLSNRTHSVISGFCLIFPEKTIVDYEKTLITFDKLDDAFIENYIESGSCFDKAGAYGIQDKMIKSVTKSIEGDYNNVVGLPVKTIEKILLENLRYGAN